LIASPRGCRVRGGEAPSSTGLIVMGHLFLAAAFLAVAMAASSRALAQPVALVVNGEAITDDDIEQRTKFNQLANHKDPARREVIEELIDDRLKVQAARAYKIDIMDKDVDAQYADMAKRMHLTADDLTQTLGRAGVDAQSFKAKVLADLSWQYVIRGLLARGPPFNEQQVGEQNASSEAAHQTKGNPDVEYNYSLWPVLFRVPPGNADLRESHMEDAEALRARFTDCDSGLAAARTQPDVVIGEPITKNSSDLVFALRELLANTELGHLTPPETTAKGVQLFAVCARKETLTGLKTQAFFRAFLRASDAYLRELRRRADIRSVRDDVRGDISNDRFPSVTGAEPARR
jgi:peptidyl-prolyl cis-trans isomerase SurA